DAAVQPDRPSRDFDSVRKDRRRTAGGPAARRPSRPHRRSCSNRTGLRRTAEMNDRMPPIPKPQWTDSQSAAAAEFLKMRGQERFGPFALMLRSPEVMLRAGAMGDYLRYRTSLPRALNEMIILLTARHWSQQFEWYVHQPAALKAGLNETIVHAISKGRRP